MKNKGRFIVVEGLEGAGKSTAIQTIASVLTQTVGEPLLTREPGGTDVGEAVRTLIKAHRDHHPLDDRTELLLLYAARTQLVEQVIKPALENGQWVVSDRFELSTFAYQGGGRAMSPQLLSALSTLALDGFKPDLTLFLDIHPERGLERVSRRGESDRIELESKAFFQAVYDAYHRHIEGDAAVVCIDAEQSIADVAQAIRQHLIDYIGQYGR